MFRSRRKLAVKILLPLVILLLGMSTTSCVGFGAGQAGWSGVAVADGNLFFGSINGKLIALDISNGNLLWSEEEIFKTSGSAGFLGCAPQAAAVAFYGTPAVGGELVYIGGYNGKIYAVNSSTRLSKDKYLDEDHPQPIIGGPVVAQGKVYIASSDGKLYALDATSLEEEWKFETGDKIWSTPAIDGDTVYIGSFDKKLYALSADEGGKRWEFTTGGAIVAQPVIHQGTVYAASFDRHIYALDAASGQLLWQFPANGGDETDPQKWFWTSPVVYDNTIYAPSMDGRVYVLNAQSGAMITTIDLGSPISSSPVAAEGKVIVATEDGKLYSIDTTSNQSTEMRTLAGKVSAPITISNGVVYVHVQEDEAIYAIDSETGTVLWNTPVS